MKTARFLRALPLAGVVALATVALAKPPPADKVTISKEAALALIDTEFKSGKRINPQRLLDYLGTRGDITVAEFLFITQGPPDDRPDARRLKAQTGPAPRHAMEWREIELRFAALEQINRTKGDPTTAKDYEKRLRAQALPGATWFTMEQALNAEAYEFLKPGTAEQRQQLTEEQRQELKEEQEQYAVLSEAQDKVEAQEEQKRHPFRGLHLRRSWLDVLYEEDPSNLFSKGDEVARHEDDPVPALGDLEGAHFSYVRDGLADSDTWNIHGALIAPFAWQWSKDMGFALRRFAFAPSVTYDRVTTNGDPAIEVDSLSYRAGLYWELFGYHRVKKKATSEEPDRTVMLGYGAQVRAAGVHLTDTDHHAGLTAFELDFEPRFHFGEVRLGYTMNLVPKIPARADGADDSFLTAQVRVWLHLEGGDVQELGPAWTALGDSFFRLGAVAQLTLTMPEPPWGGRRFSLILYGSYLGALDGPSENPGYFRAALVQDLYQNWDESRKISLSANYERGGLGLTQQEVDTFTLGFNVLF